MENGFPIPDFQPIPFPAPVGLLKFFLVVGFYLHALPMNVALVGGLISAAFIFYGTSRNHPYAARLGNALAFSIPFFISFAITMGVVPLLFLQLVYGPLFYTSSILMALPWLLIIGLLMTGYYSFYVFSYRRHILGRRAPWILVGATVLFLAIAFFFTNNTTLMLTPERWVPLYQNSPYGLNLNWGEPQLLPRYLHFVISAVAVTSLVIGSFGIYWYRRDRPYGQWLIRSAAMVFLIVTLIQFPIGIWFLLSLPQAVWTNFVGGDPLATGIFAAAMGLDVTALGAMLIASREGNPLPFWIGMGATLVVIFLMVVIRHLVRVYYTQPFFSPNAFQAEPQWLLIGLFAFFALALAFYWAWLVKVLWQAFHPTPGEI